MRLDGPPFGPRRSVPLGCAPRRVEIREFTVIVAAAALFGIAAETALAHFRLDIPATWSALRGADISLVQLALSWWSLWLAGWIAFLIGWRGAAWAATRLKFKLKVATGVLAFLLFAAAGQLGPGSSGLGIGTTMLVRGAAPLATIALALWGFAAARRRPGQSAWAALHEPFETSAAIVLSPDAVRPRAGDRPRPVQTESDRADLVVAREVLEQLSPTSFRTLGL
jgi:hypothetical protein